jgi:hypothetical protein
MRSCKEECAAGTGADTRQPCRPDPWLPDSAKGCCHSSQGSGTVALVLRLVSVPGADRGRRHWQLTVAGHAMTAVCVPLLAITPLSGVDGVAVRRRAGVVARAWLTPRGATPVGRVAEADLRYTAPLSVSWTSVGRPPGRF